MTGGEYGVGDTTVGRRLFQQVVALKVKLAKGHLIPVGLVV